MQKNHFLEKYLWKEKACSKTVKDALILDCAGKKMPIEKQQIKNLKFFIQYSLK